MILGGNYAFGRHTGGSLDPIGLKLLTDLPSSIARIGLPLRKFHEIGDSGGVHEHFLALQQHFTGFQTLLGSIWWIPTAWQESWLTVKPAHGGDLLDLLRRWVETAASYGIHLTALSFNEPNQGVKVKWTPADLAQFIAQATASIPVKWMVGDTSHPTACHPFLDAVLANPQAKANSYGVAWHTWAYPWAWKDEAAKRLSDRAHAESWPSWATEVGVKSSYPLPYPWPTQGFADGIQQMLVRVRDSGADAALYWQYSPDGPQDFPVLDATLSPYPIFHTLKAWTLPPPTPPPSPPADPRVTAKQKLLGLGLTSAEADVVINN